MPLQEINSGAYVGKKILERFDVWMLLNCSIIFVYLSVNERKLHNFRQTGFDFTLRKGETLFGQMGIGVMFAPLSIQCWENQPIGKGVWCEAHAGFGLRWNRDPSKKWYMLGKEKSCP